MKILILLALLNSGQVRDNVLASNQRDTVCLSYLTVKQFKNQLAVLETGGLKQPYQAVNQYGYMGKYQISHAYLQKFGRVTKEEFLRSSWKQEVTMNRLIAHYLNFIWLHGWDKYIGTIIDGTLVTLEGLLAGYHLYPVALKLWLTGKGLTDLKDGNGTPVSRYVKHFDYRLR